MYDAIIVLGGGELSEGRINEAIRLYRQGIAKYLIIVGGKDDYKKCIKSLKRDQKYKKHLF
jgi:acetylglutamate kinase